MQRSLLLLFLLMAAPLAAQDSWSVKRINLSAGGRDYAPALLDSTVVFVSVRDRGELVTYRDARTGDPLSDVYSFNWNGTQADAPKLFQEGVNTKLHDGPVSFNAAGDLLCVTRNTGNPDKPGKAGQLGLFFHRRTANGWGPAEAFPHNDDRHAVIHGALSPDGLRLVFASNMPGGKGGSDLYVSDLLSDGWSSPRALDAVNGPGNELFPMITAQGDLYFSSDRAGGMGKLDIFQAAARGLSWTAPTLLPEPINSPGNDFGVALFQSGRAGFISSDRNGEDALYAIELSIPPFADCQPERQDDLCFRFVAPRGAILPGMAVHYRWTMGDNTVYEQDVVEHCYAKPGNYAVTLDLVDDGSDNVFLRGTPHTVSARTGEMPRISTSEHPVLGRQVHVEALRVNPVGFRPEAYFWDMGDGNVLRTPNPSYTWTKPGVNRVRLDVQGYESRTGKIVSRCVTRDLLVVRRGEASADNDRPTMNFQELPQDHFSFGFLDGEDGHFHIELFASPERVGLKDPMFAEVNKYYRVYERYDINRGVFSYSVGQSGNIADAYELYKRMRELQFMNAEILRATEENVTDLSDLDLYANVDLTNVVIRSSTVRFATGSHTVEKRYHAQLKKFIRLLQEKPGLHFSVEAHTDDVGTAENNLALSQRRAQSLVEHFVNAGIARERMVPVGHGQHRPIADNSNEKGRAENRRVEFRLQDTSDQASQLRDNSSFDLEP